MNKAEYKSAFAGVGPRPEAVEKILLAEAEAPKKKRYAVRAAVSLLAAALLLGALALTANAATNGRLYEGVKLIAEGEKLELLDFIRHYEEYFDENGNFIRETTVVSADGRSKSWVRTQERPDGGSGISIGFSVVDPEDAETADESTEERTEETKPAETAAP